MSSFDRVIRRPWRRGYVVNGLYLHTTKIKEPVNVKMCMMKYLTSGISISIFSADYVFFHLIIDGSICDASMMQILFSKINVEDF